jgi:hypothetical protein
MEQLAERGVLAADAANVAEAEGFEGEDEFAHQNQS